MNSARTKYFKPLLALLALIFFAGSFFAQRSLNRARDTMGLTRRDNPLENAPPVLAFTTVALGGFRGLIANALWIRASDLEDEGKYFEVVQLADWITKLEPYFPAVWVHQAWNMAYNISVKFNEPRDRWLWVQRGLELLRDQGLKYNPHETLIYREIAWFFQHKMGQDLDDAHFYYKNMWAREMSKVFPDGRPVYEALLNPATDEQRAQVKLLNDQYKMQPAPMKRVDDAYGPLDWRLPETHAIYWAMLGLEKAKREDLIQLRRVIYQSMQLAFQRGRLIEIRSGPEDRNYELAPNLDILDKANKAYEDMMQQDAEMRDHIKTGHRNFLQNAVYFLFTHNRRREAQEWFARLKERYPNWLKDLEATNPAWYHHIRESAQARNLPEINAANVVLDDFAIGRIMEHIGETSHTQIMSLLQSYLINYYYSLAIGQDNRALGALEIAKDIWKRFQRAVSDPQQQKRVGLLPFVEIQRDVQNRVLNPQEEILSPTLRDQLRSLLGLPPPTNAVPAATNAPRANQPQP